MPVLSEQITVQLPSVSTALSFFTIARCLANRCTPSAIIIVMTAGKLSGIAATAKATEIRKAFMISAVCAKKISIIKITAAIISIAIEVTLPIFEILFSSGVTILVLVSIIFAILPSSVFSPTLVTTPSPCPYVITDPLNAMLRLSGKWECSSKIKLASFKTCLDSPVILLSLLFKE